MKTLRAKMELEREIKRIELNNCLILFEDKIFVNKELYSIKRGVANKINFDNISINDEINTMAMKNNPYIIGLKDNSTYSNLGDIRILERYEEFLYSLDLDNINVEDLRCYMYNKEKDYLH